ncbi:uncharacterized protein LOC141660279 [Apium graveolens]|uniref:uncharacterized protein LOC141660279 n=1 Tax=Apium graveolens TaxID=4045 RepID=UPI003D7ABE32
MDATYESHSRFVQELTQAPGTAFSGLGANIQWPVYGEDSAYLPPETPPSEELREYYDDNNMELRFTSVVHPEANGKVEVANRIVLDGLKKRVERSRNTWAEELMNILWVYHTTCKVITEATPFMLAYGAEAVVTLEITHGSPRIKAYEPETNEEGMRLVLDLIDEVRDKANARNVEHQ